RGSRRRAAPDGRRPPDRDRPTASGRAQARRSVRARMKVTRLPDLESGSHARHVAIGSFDGVHLGHREVIGGADTVLTFEPHPLAVIRPESAPKLIYPFEVKRD